MSEIVEGRSYEDVMVEHLKNGPNTTILEFDREYFEIHYGPDGYGAGWAVALQKTPDNAESTGLHIGAEVAVGFYRAKIYGYDHLSGIYKGVERHYKDAALSAWQTIKLNPDAKVDDMKFRDDLFDITSDELREAARLAIQFSKVFEAIARTGHVPEEV